LNEAARGIVHLQGATSGSQHKLDASVELVALLLRRFNKGAVKLADMAAQDLAVEIYSVEVVGRATVTRLADRSQKVARSRDFSELPFSGLKREHFVDFRARLRGKHPGAIAFHRSQKLFADAMYHVHDASFERATHSDSCASGQLCNTAL